MMGTIKTNGLESPIDIIAYIPAHRRKEALRGQTKLNCWQNILQKN